MIRESYRHAARWRWSCWAVAAALLIGGALTPDQALAQALPGAGGAAGDVAISNGAATQSFKLVCGNGATVDYGVLATGESRHVTKWALETCNGQALWVSVDGTEQCRYLTDYRTDYAPINFGYLGFGKCALGGVTPTPPEPPTPPPPPPAPGGKYILGGWVGDDDWNTPLPAGFGKVDALNLGYITCISTLKNGRCDSPGIRNANDGPPPALAAAATSMLYVLGGDGCNTAGWNSANIANTAKKWSGVDFDNECAPKMTTGQVNEAIAMVGAVGRESIVTYLSDTVEDKRWLTTLSPTPAYYAAMAFWGTEFCGQRSRAQGCVQHHMGPYETVIPNVVIKPTLDAIGQENSRKMILGIHALGTNEDTVDFWCRQVKENNLGGVYVSFIHKMPLNLFQRLRSCLAE